jgi:hypothetical protein
VHLHLQCISWGCSAWAGGCHAEEVINSSQGAAASLEDSMLAVEKSFLLLLAPSLLYVLMYITSEDEEGYLVTAYWTSSVALAIGSHKLFLIAYAATTVKTSASTSASTRKKLPVLVSTVLLVLASPLLVLLHNCSHGG